MTSFSLDIERMRNAIGDLQVSLLPIVQNAALAMSATQELQSHIAGSLPFFEALVVRDRWETYANEFVGRHAEMLAGLDRHNKAHMIVSAQLPSRRGWYLSGREPCTLSLSLAKAVMEENWEQVDREVMQHLPKFKMDLTQKWLAEEGVPEYCIARFVRVVKHHQDQNYEEATYMGIPLIDEISQYLYQGRPFTTKRHVKRGFEQPKPEIAIKTVSGQELSRYCRQFVEVFGSLQADTDRTRLSDVDYWNRHAIVHGLMKRSMGEKDSAKCLMALKFLFFARKAEEEAAAEEEDQEEDVGSETNDGDENEEGQQAG